MDIIVYRGINKLYDDIEKFNIILNNIDLLKNGYINTFSISKCKKVFSSLREKEDFEASKRLNGLIIPELKGDLFEIISVLIEMYKMHSILRNLTIFFYMSKYKCCDTQRLNIFFELSLREYMGFFLEVKEIFQLESSQLNTFVSSGLILLNEATNVRRNYLIDYFYSYHFNYKFLKKEYSETQSVFDQVDFKKKSTVNICAGNACGIHLLDTKITCIDLNQYYGMMMLEKLNICNFIQCDIMDSMFETIVPLFQAWIAIHACRNLSIRIMEVFKKHASAYSELYLVPCCTFGIKYYQQNLDEFMYNRLYKMYYTKSAKLRQYLPPVMHFELLCSYIMYKFKIKTLTNMQSVANKIIIVYK